jgi:hypothetical protein
MMRQQQVAAGLPPCFLLTNGLFLLTKPCFTVHQSNEAVHQSHLLDQVLGQIFDLNYSTNYKKNITTYPNYIKLSGLQPGKGPA